MNSFDVAFNVRDDGPSPGNRTASDRIDVRVSLADQTATATATVLNVAPWFVHPPALTFETDDQGTPIAVVTAEFADPGLLDMHRLHVRWGDGSISTAITTPLLPNQAFSFTRTLRVTRSLSGNERDLRPLNITLQDDDTGQAAFHIAALDVRLNNDDDNNNQTPDYQERTVQGENDILPLSLAAITALVPAGAVGNYGFQYDTNVLRIWDSEDKQNLILSSNGSPAFPGGPQLVGIPYTGQETVWIEGVGIHTTPIALSWMPQVPPEPAEGTSAIPLGSVRVTVWGLDLDIDSDNNNGFNLPTNSDWEEYIEAHSHAIGKMLTTRDTHFTPIRLRLPRGLDVNDPDIRVTLTRTASQSGEVRLWNTFRADPQRSQEPVDQGGSLIGTAANGSFSLNELRYDPVDGGITIWAEAINVTNNHDTKVELDNNNKPTDFLTAAISGLPWNDLQDQVKFMVVHPESFYPTLDTNLHVRNAFAAEAVYEPHDAPKYSLKELTREEVTDLLSPHLAPRQVRYFLTVMYDIPEENDIDDEDEDLPSSGSLKSRIYLDFSSNDRPEYVFSFAGTELHNAQDILVNLHQFLEPAELSYFYAVRLARLLGLTPIPFTTTGHSLGGGLATAAAIGASAVRSIDVISTTYNAAGLQEHSLTRASGREIIPGILAKYRNASTFVTNYTVALLPGPSDSTFAPDLLTLLQENIPALPHARGLPMPGRGLNMLDSGELRFLARATQLLAEWYPNKQSLIQINIVDKFINTPELAAALVLNTVNPRALISKLLDSHSLPSIHHSLLSTSIWNVYDTTETIQEERS